MNTSVQSSRSAFWSMMIAIFLGNFSAILSTATMNVPLPTLMKLFSTELGVLQWAVTGFTLATGVAAPLVGFLGQRFGVRKTYLCTLVGFIGSSCLCACAWNVPTLILFRVVQGLFCGIIIPITMTIIYTYVEKKEQAFAMSMWSMSGVLAPACGPTIAGLIVQYLHWNWIFLINVPICILAILLSYRFIPKDSPEQMSHLPFDRFGLFLSTIGTASLLTAFSMAQAWGVADVKTIVLAVIGVVGLAFFAKRAFGSEHALLNFSVFRYRSFAIASLSNFMITLLLNCSIFVLPLYLQMIRGFSAVETGMVIFVGPIAVATVSPIMGKIYRRNRAKKAALFGLCFMLTGFALLTQVSESTAVWYLMCAIISLEAGMGIIKIATTNYGMEVLPVHLSGHGSGVTSWIKQSSGALAVGIITSALLLRTDARLAALGGGDALYNTAYVGGMRDIFTAAVIGVCCFALLLIVFMHPKADDKKAL